MQEQGSCQLCTPGSNADILLVSEHAAATTAQSSHQCRLLTTHSSHWRTATRETACPTSAPTSAAAAAAAVAPAATGSLQGQSQHLLLLPAALLLKAHPKKQAR